MIDLNSESISFKTEKQVEAYAKFFLGVKDFNFSEGFQSKEEFDDFLIERERAIKFQLNLLGKLDLTQVHKTRVSASYYKIVSKDIQKPLSSDGAAKKSSRFNFKDIQLLKNRVVYFGKSKACCEIEKFHMPYVRDQIRKTVNGTLHADEIPFHPHLIKEYNVELNNVLVITSKSTCDAIGIREQAVKNEWYEFNEVYDMPSSSQIFGAIARTAGFDGIMYTSARYHLDNNLVVFEENHGELKFEEKSSTDYVPSDNILKE